MPLTCKDVFNNILQSHCDSFTFSFVDISCTLSATYLYAEIPSTLYVTLFNGESIYNLLLSSWHMMHKWRMTIVYDNVILNSDSVDDFIHSWRMQARISKSRFMHQLQLFSRNNSSTHDRIFRGMLRAGDPGNLKECGLHQQFLL